MFISYAQNFEDALLWRALGSVPRGFYIDVGAADPVYESVTKAFSLAGWTGINIDASASAHLLLTADRPHDVNLRLVVASRDGVADFYSIEEGNGLSTTEAGIAEQHAASGWRHAIERVETATLASICTKHAPEHIHFLKIDVEGGERDVLVGADFGRFRPWVVIVESVRPVALRDAEGRPVESAEAPTEAHHEWEHILVEAGYHFTLFDGLNRVYVAAEHADRLAPLLTRPVSVFDAARRHTDVDLERRLATTVAELADLAASSSADIRSLSDRVEQLRSEHAHIAAALERTALELEAEQRATAELRSELDLRAQYHFQTARALSLMTAAAQQAESERARCDEWLQHQAADIQRLTTLAEHRELVMCELDAIHASKAWRLTAPLRGVRRLFGSRGRSR